ncbi:MAG: ThiF family adenylyltransferase [Alphaproteobacteria bacterium]|nr:ThiF family adenylyltransferase [Alphaproteobacteria bacterium]
MLRYARQTVLPEIGQEGQERLKSASVLCIGTGGLGSPALLYLAAAGIGRIGLVDDDMVDISNLQRQVLFKETDQGKSKVEAAKAALAELNSQCQIEAYHQRFIPENAEALIQNYDVIIDGTDNFSSKFLINDACVKFGKPLVYGSILGFVAQVSVFWAKGENHHGPCYRCLYPKPPGGHIPNCAEAGVIGAMAGIAGTVQALEAIKMVLGLKWCKEKNLEPLLGTLWILDARTMQTKTLILRKRHQCSACARDPNDILLTQAEESCATKSNVKNISAEDAANQISKAVFIDVREAHELASGRIPKALHIPLGTLLSNEDSVGDIASDTPVIVYCQHGIRSFSAASHLIALGFRNVAHINGGIVRWKGELA